MKIAILGGSFNPVHLGHLHIAEQTQSLLGYEKIFFVPAYISPFKEKPMEVSNSERIRVLKKALQYNRDFQIENIEIKRKGLSYTYDTVLYLNQKYKKKLQSEEGIFQKIGLILGADLLPDFHKWHKYEKLAEMVHFILAKRHGSKIMEKDVEVQKAIEGFPFPHSLLENTFMDISSTDIREKIQKGEDWQDFLPKSSVKYIEKKGLYA